MNEDIGLYRTRKLINNIIFNFYENDYEEDPECFDLLIVESLKNIVEYYANNNFLSEAVKNNIYNYLTQAREYEDDNKKQRLELINDIIGIVNSQKKDESIIFYKIELYKRRKRIGDLLELDDKKIEKEIENVHDSICHDLWVITSHTDDATSEEVFQSEYLPYFKDSNFYYESLNAMLDENPIVFQNQTFYNRMMQVINLNNSLYNDNKKVLNMNKKILKKINRYVKSK